MSQGHDNMKMKSIQPDNNEVVNTSPKKLVPVPTPPLQPPDAKENKAPVLNKVGYVEEEEKQFVQGINVRAATLHQLASLAIECFSIDGEVLQEKKEFPRVLLLMHQWFVTSEELADIFLDLYKSCDSQVICTLAYCKHRQNTRECMRRHFKAKVCHVVRYWIGKFPVHYDLNRKLAGSVNKLQDLIRRDEPDSQLAELVDISKVPSYDWMRNMSVRNPSTRHTGKKVTLVFNKLGPDELAEQLTFLEFKAFRRITFNDFKHYAVYASLKENPKLERSIALFNGLSQWTQCMVLSKTTPQQRADVMVKFVNVAKKLHELQNFNTLMAVVGGLTHSCLARLGKTNSCLPSETQKLLVEYTELLSSSNNFSNYRKALAQCTGFRIPILGVHLKDLILLHTALSDRVDNLINFRKMAQLSIIFTELMEVMNTSPPIESNMDLVNLIRLALDLHYTEDEIYELSLAREPRNSLSAPSTPTKPVVFADWVAGVSPPDQDTINKHVHDMVEAVFKNYDHDKDGFISHEEFEAISGNFPFIDSFCVLDADKDGMISKAEMKTYFIRANCHALRKCFKHAFHETTYFKPTFCIHCTGLLWGVIKQGWKCKECGINAHKHCKDLVVMECRSKTNMGTHGRSNSVSSTVHGDVTIASKRRMSQRQRRSRRSQSTQTEDSHFMMMPSRSLKGTGSQTKRLTRGVQSEPVHRTVSEGLVSSRTPLIPRHSLCRETDEYNDSVFITSIMNSGNKRKDSDKEKADKDKEEDNGDSNSDGIKAKDIVVIGDDSKKNELVSCLKDSSGNSSASPRESASVSFGKDTKEPTARSHSVSFDKATKDIHSVSFLKDPPVRSMSYPKDNMPHVGLSGTLSDTVGNVGRDSITGCNKRDSVNSLDSGIGEHNSKTSTQIRTHKPIKGPVRFNTQSNLSSSSSELSNVYHHKMDASSPTSDSKTTAWCLEEPTSSTFNLSNLTSHSSVSSNLSLSSRSSRSSLSSDQSNASSIHQSPSGSSLISQSSTSSFSVSPSYTTSTPTYTSRGTRLSSSFFSDVEAIPELVPKPSSSSNDDKGYVSGSLQSSCSNIEGCGEGVVLSTSEISKAVRSQLYARELMGENNTVLESLVGSADEDDEDACKLLQENEDLRCQLENKSEQISTLKTHIGVIRQHTITFILDQMDTLHLQKDTQV